MQALVWTRDLCATYKEDTCQLWVSTCTCVHVNIGGYGCIQACTPHTNKRKVKGKRFKDSYILMEIFSCCSIVLDNNSTSAHSVAITLLLVFWWSLISFSSHVFKQNWIISAFAGIGRFFLYWALASCREAFCVPPIYQGNDGSLSMLSNLTWCGIMDPSALVLFLAASWSILFWQCLDCSQGLIEPICCSFVRCALRSKLLVNTLLLRSSPKRAFSFSQEQRRWVEWLLVYQSGHDVWSRYWGARCRAWPKIHETH